jgi:hypothetical protein
VSRWIEEVEEPSFAGLELYHFYRALDVLWEYKERLEEDLFRKRRDLFSQEVDLVFFDTTTVSFQGEGPAGLAEYGHSRGKRPDLRRIVVAVAMTEGGVPIAHEVFPGSTADVRSFARAITSLRERFPVGRVIVVSDGGRYRRRTWSFCPPWAFPTSGGEDEAGARGRGGDLLPPEPVPGGGGGGDR